MREINLPVKYALSPVSSMNKNVVAYIIVKCYFIEGSITCNLDGTMDAKCKVIDCQDKKNAFVNGRIDPKYIREVSCVFNDIDLAKDEQRKVNELIIEQYAKSGQVTDLVEFKEKQLATVKSMEKLRSIKEKGFTITATSKKLIYSKE